MKKGIVHKEVNIDGEFYEQQETILVNETGERGWGKIGFLDRYGSNCSLQDSSIATEACIWLGVHDIKPQIMVEGKGWVAYPIPEEVLLNSRMHLTQSMVKQILPFLQHFAKTGNYLTKMNEFNELPIGEE